MPLSEGYDFIGPIMDRRPVREEPVEEQTDNNKETAEEGAPVPETEDKTVEETVEESVEEEEVPEEEEKELSYVELTYEDLQGSKPMDKLPTSKSGNYIIVYRSKTCPYCDMLLKELKDKTGDYVLVSVMCKGQVRDLFYSRWVYSWPSFTVLKNKRVTYYGVGYRSLEDFKRLL